MAFLIQVIPSLNSKGTYEFLGVVGLLPYVEIRRGSSFGSHTHF